MFDYNAILSNLGLKDCKVLFAGLWGSRRYNLHLHESSDHDGLVVYMASTTSLLSSFTGQPAKGVVKDKNEDILVMEIGYFLNSLVEGDSVVVESLYQNPTTTIFQSLEFESLMRMRSFFLTQALVTKMVRHAMGGNGVQFILENKNKQKDKAALAKKWYISYRLLLSAHSIVDPLKRRMKCYYDLVDPHRDFLLQLRQGNYHGIRSISLFEGDNKVNDVTSEEEEDDEAVLLRRARSLAATIEADAVTRLPAGVSLYTKTHLENWLFHLRESYLWQSKYNPTEYNFGGMTQEQQAAVRTTLSNISLQHDIIFAAFFPPDRPANLVVDKPTSAATRSPPLPEMQTLPSATTATTTPHTMPVNDVESLPELFVIVSVNKPTIYCQDLYNARFFLEREYKSKSAQLRKLQKKSASSSSAATEEKQRLIEIAHVGTSIFKEEWLAEESVSTMMTQASFFVNREHNSTLELTLHETKPFLQLIWKRRFKALQLLMESSSSATLLPFTIVYSTPMWEDLKKRALDGGAIERKTWMYNSDYVKQCLNQAQGMMTQMKIKRAEKLKRQQQCSSTSNVVYGYSILEQHIIDKAVKLVKASRLAYPACDEIVADTIVKSNSNSTKTNDDILGLYSGFQQEYTATKKVLDKVMETDLKMSSESVARLYSDLNSWLLSVRKLNSGVGNTINGKNNKDEKLDALLKEIGIPLTSDRVLLLLKAGSAMYNLATSTSDVDYFCVYAAPLDEVLSMNGVTGHIEHHVASKPGDNDKSDVVEYTCDEVGPFVENLIKGNPKNIEMLFIDRDKVLYESKMWSALRESRMRIAQSQRCLDQYEGFIFNRLGLIEHPKENTLPPSKLFYHIYHKLFELKQLVDMKDILVHLPDGHPQREWIMKLRSQALQGDLAVPKLIERVREEMKEIQRRRLELVDKFPAECDMHCLSDWLVLVREQFG